MTDRRTITTAIALAVAALGTWTYAQQTTTPADPNAAGPSAPQTAPGPADPAQAGNPAGFTQAPTPLPQGELDQLVAPVALYPDALLSQVLIASTYPLEIVQARRFVDANPNLQGDPLADELAKQPWDPSVKSLITTPTVLKLMDERLDWTIKLGDAFLAEQRRVMDTVQRLRADAQRAGYLQNTEQQRVTVTPAPSGPPVGNAYDPNGAYDPAPTQTIVIDNTSPDTYYVPVYDPGVVYGTWAYPNYRPFFWRPAGYYVNAPYYYARPCPIGPAWSYAFGYPDWRGGRLDLNFERNARYNTRLDRDQSVRRYREREQAARESAVRRDAIGRNDNERTRGPDGRPDPRNDAPVWRHDSTHRLGVAYRDPIVAQRFNGRTPDAAARNSYRGRPDTNAGAANGPGGTNQSQNGSGRRTPDAADRPADRNGRRDASQNPIAPNVARPGPQVTPATPDATPNGRNDAVQQGGRTPTPDRAAPRGDATPDRGAQPTQPPTQTRQRDRGGALDAGNGDTARAEAARGQASRRGNAQPNAGPAAQPDRPTPAPRPAQQAPVTPAPARPVPAQPAPSAPAAPRGSAPERPSAPAQPAPSRAAPERAAPAAPADRGGASGGAAGGASRGGGGGGSNGGGASPGGSSGGGGRR